MKKMSIINVLLLFIPLVVFATPVPDTGQTKCYDNTQEITCPNPGEPFYGQDPQYDYHQQSYTKLDAIGNDLPDEATEWIMVRDNITGLIWEVKQDRDNIVNYENPHDADNRFNWYDSNPETNGGEPGIPWEETGTEAFINALNTSQFGGFEDWRMPTIKELAFIRNMNTFSPAIDTNYFLNTQIDLQYWSSTTKAGPGYSKFYAWHVSFDDGSISTSDKGIVGRYARAVRGSQQTQNLTDNGDGTITDTNTGFMWEQKAIENMYDTYSWQEALAFCANLILNNDGEWTSGNPNASGIKYDDWRLPNVNELQSLVNYNFYLPAINPVFSNTAHELMYSYWSSTILENNVEFPFIVDFTSGGISPSLDRYYPNDHYVRAVRGCELIDDFDCDGILDGSDNCPNNYNPEQENSDEDNLGSACDNCPNNTNPNQEDADYDRVGDVCDICPNDPLNDVDNDGICGDIDNCPENFNPLQEDTDGSGIADACNDELDLDDDEWEEDFDNCLGNYNPLQEDTYPPQGNGIGDACDCESDFDCDGDVDGTDATTFKLYFGRNLLFYPCDEINPCRGDFDCDQDCDGTDAVLFKADFGRSIFYNPCPACTVENWCFNSEEPPPSTSTTTTMPVTTTTTSVQPECLVNIIPSSATLYTWETVQFSTTLSGDCNPPCYDWDVESSIGSTINNTGLYTAGGSQGIDTVEVTDNCNTNTYNSAVVEVYLFPTTTVPPTTTTTAP